MSSSASGFLPSSSHFPSVSPDCCGAPLECGGGGLPSQRSLRPTIPAQESEPVLDAGLTRAMGRLLAAGRCADAAALATGQARAELAARARQLCPGN